MVRFTPDIPAQHVAGYGLPYPAQQIHENLVLACAQLNGLSCPLYCALEKVYFQIAAGEECLALGFAPAEQRPDARHQLGKRERLNEIIVCPRIETTNTILDRIARGE